MRLLSSTPLRLLSGLAALAPALTATHSSAQPVTQPPAAPNQPPPAPQEPPATPAKPAAPAPAAQTPAPAAQAAPAATPTGESAPEAEVADEPAEPATTGLSLSGSANVDAGLSTEAASESAAPPPPPSAFATKAPWYERIEIGAFVDGYFAVNYNFPKPQGGTTVLRAFDDNNGFALSWAGVNLNYEADPVGGTIQLRLGPSAATLARQDAAHGLEFVKQAFVTWQPDGKGSAFSVDFGKFDKIVGTEVADSQLNMNYSRGLLYTLAQPYFHTGLRGRYALSEQFALSAIAVNGWDNTVDNNAGKTFGLQLAMVLPEGDEAQLDARLSYLIGPEKGDVFEASCDAGQQYDPRTNSCAAGNAGPSTYPVDRGDANTKGLRHLIDLAIVAHPTEDVSLSLNGDYAIERRGIDTPAVQLFETVTWYGVSLGGRYQIDEVFAAGGRFEYFGDPDGVRCGALCANLRYDDLSLLSGTVTLEAAPARHLLIRLDGRLDGELDGKGIFPVIRSHESTQFTTTLGVVATTN